MLRVHSIQTQAIQESLLPQHTSQSFAKKADLAFAFTSDHPTVADAVEPVYRACPGMPLSQMTDAYTSMVPMACCVEVKEKGGDYNEAIVQLGIWSAAGLERVRGLRAVALERRRHNVDIGKMSDELDDATEENDLPPFLGWTVVGHDWRFYIIWKEKDGNVIVLGPWRTLNAGTGSHADILTLIISVQTVKCWLEEEYWSWLCENVLDGLSLSTDPQEDFHL